MKQYKEPILACLLVTAVVATQLDIRFFSRFAIGVVLLVSYEIGRMYGMRQAVQNK